MSQDVSGITRLGLCGLAFLPACTFTALQILHGGLQVLQAGAFIFQQGKEQPPQRLPSDIQPA